ncbi:hypothetical protein LX87_02261 [Larkinella arboricola]|uniref:Uncharacterized protein n=1 Tax=Larkinella arboricola TaxID=643671 RepID=A0A327X616_LARAB|nr:hypothetical protein [Larkinella arboricola]RAK00553.1 hypothetical protein LX87_02261 [Larkinella arboricola]
MNERQLIKHVQQQYSWLKVNLEQAERIYRFEQDKNLPSNTHYFSEWEEWDFERASFQAILTSEQFAKYEERQKEVIRNAQISRVEEDKARQKEIAYHQRLLEIYDQILPDFFKNPRINNPIFFEATKIDFLKAEYRRYLTETKKALLVDHFRFCRTLMPRTLKISLLQHQLSCVWPDYFSFKRRMDEPTKATALYLEKKLSYIADETYEFVTKKMDELNSLNEENHREIMKTFQWTRYHLWS